MKRRKKSHRNYVAMAYRIDSLGYGRQRVDKRHFFKTLIAFLDGNITELPAGWNITWRWQNSKKHDWREDEFTETVGNSREGFMTLMRRRLKRDLASLEPKRRKRKRGKKRKRNKGKSKRTRRVSKVRRKKSRRARRGKQSGHA